MSPKFKLGDTVAQIVDDCVEPGMVTSIIYYLGGSITYSVAWATALTTQHHAEELTLLQPLHDDFVNEDRIE